MDAQAERTGVVMRADGVPLAYASRGGRGPTVVVLPGFASEMTGAKAMALDAACAQWGRAVLRLDYSGHGASGGVFTDGDVGMWAEDARTVIESQASGPLVLVGSSMGGWIALLLAKALGARVRGLLLIAAAPDFTERLMWEAMAPAERAALERDGVMMVPSRYGPPTPITARLIERGRAVQVLTQPIPFTGPVRLLHGQADPDVPWELSLETARVITGPDVRTTFVKDGDHRLSRPQDLDLLTRTLEELLTGLTGEDRA